MKQSIITSLTLVIITASSCSDSGTKIDAQDPQEITMDIKEKSNNYTRINENSTVFWRASHLGGVQKRFGEIKLKSGEFLVENNNLIKGKVVMDMNSFTVDNFPDGDENEDKLRTHLQSADFFDVKNHPTASFELSKIDTTTGNYSSLITGNLTIMNVSKSITFKANVSVSNEAISIESEDFTLNRTDWNLTYNMEGTKGVPVDYLISNDMGFTIRVTIEK